MAVDGSVVCDQHGGSAPQVLRRAAERVQMTADDAAQQLVEWMEDPNVAMRERVKIAQDLMDRAGLGAAQVHKIMPVTEDPIEKLFCNLLSDPNAFEAPGGDPEPPRDRYYELQTLLDADEDDIVDAVIVEDEEPRRPQSSERRRKRNPTRPPRHIQEGLDLL